VYPARNSERSTLSRGRDEQDHDDRRPVEQDGQRDQRGQHGPTQVREQHHQAPVGPVGQGARDHAEDEVGDRLEGADDAHR
jgi:hypothetical protein